MGNLIRVVIVDTDYDGTILVPEECAHKHNTGTCLHGEIDQKDYNRYMDLQKQIEKLSNEAYSVILEKVVKDYKD